MLKQINSSHLTTHHFLKDAVGRLRRGVVEVASRVTLAVKWICGDGREGEGEVGREVGGNRARDGFVVFVSLPCNLARRRRSRIKRQSARQNRH